MGTFVQTHKVVRVTNVTAANAFTLSDYVCSKDALRVTFLISHSGTTDTDLTLGLKEATAVAGGTSAAVTATFPIWIDIDHGTSSDELSKQTDAASYALDPATAGSALVVFEWDPTKHTAGYDCIAVTGSGGNASNNVLVYAIIETAYPQATPPSAIID